MGARKAVKGSLLDLPWPLPALELWPQMAKRLGLGLGNGGEEINGQLCLSEKGSFLELPHF